MFPSTRHWDCGIAVALFHSVGSHCSSATVVLYAFENGATKAVQIHFVSPSSPPSARQDHNQFTQAAQLTTHPQIQSRLLADLLHQTKQPCLPSSCNSCNSCNSQSNVDHRCRVRQHQRCRCPYCGPRASHLIRHKAHDKRKPKALLKLRGKVYCYKCARNNKLGRIFDINPEHDKKLALVKCSELRKVSPAQL